MIKPNLVMDRNEADGDLKCLYRLPSVVVLFLFMLGGNGRIIIGDALMQKCNFDKPRRENGYDDLLYQQAQLKP